MELYELGSAIEVENEFKEHSGFSGAVLVNADSVTISVIDPAGTVKVDADDMNNFATGWYRYTVQTATDWVAGTYEIKINSSKDGQTDVKRIRKAFRLY